jgi:lipopolysaccharide/colanic/teichoic acid biosynthesis glycosyltransferase
MKIIFDKIVSFFLLLILLPFFCGLIILIFLNDFGTPFYIAPRVGKNGFLFNMIKFRSMKSIESLSNVVSTSENDPRITKIGKFIRKYKLDELSQLMNVIAGNMSIVGPRPNVKVEVDLYNQVEMKILSVKPGITDFASIVFSDLNIILSKSEDPNTDYNQLVRPWKSRLALFYIENQSFWLDIKIICLTALGILSRKISLWGVRVILVEYNAPLELINICKINRVLKPTAPPGSETIVTALARNMCN